jgi:hypothetical protein
MSFGKFVSDEAIAICDRCHEKRPYKALVSDGNSPGLRVCRDQPGCYDVKDPYRLPPHKDRPISLRFPRPDADISLPPNLVSPTPAPTPTPTPAPTPSPTPAPTPPPTPDGAYTAEDGVTLYTAEDGTTFYIAG